jgi:two-component system, OmpR family, KDP operon response regulator KdpE
MSVREIGQGTRTVPAGWAGPVAGQARKKRILVVDDQPRITRFIEIYLKLRGFDVICASSGLEALAMVNSRKPDAMLLDIIMPGMDGLEVMRRLRRFSRIPVIAISASPVHHSEAEAAGADNFLPKPFQMEEVLERINQLLGL